MSTWQEQYLAALQDRDKVEKADLDLYNYCKSLFQIFLSHLLSSQGTKLADEKAELLKKLSAQKPSEEPGRSTSPSPPPPYLVGRGLLRASSSPAPPPISADSSTLTQLRNDLSKAQTERSDLQARLDTTLRDLETVRAKSKHDTKRLAQLTSTLSQATVKLRDREEELRGKAKLLEDVQDENATLNLEIRMVEEQSEKLKRENKELVDRWMARMGKEAERMNDEHQFG
jgi:DNA repair exonuclease SbcCD ATPase subunit